MNEKITEDAIKKRVEEELERKAMNETLEEIASASSIFPDIISSLSGLRKSVEVLNKSILDVRDIQGEHNIQTRTTLKDLDNVYSKVREIEDKIITLERKLIDKNNSTSLIEVIKKIHKEQDAGMVDQNNPKSIISILKKNSTVQSTITWSLLTVITILSIISKIFGQ
jgi:hypothetical protein